MDLSPGRAVREWFTFRCSGDLLGNADSLGVAHDLSFERSAGNTRGAAQPQVKENIRDRFRGLDIGLCLKNKKE